MRSTPPPSSRTDDRRNSLPSLAGVGLLLIACVGSRFYDLAGRPIHYDEAIHCLGARDVAAGKVHKYDPPYHGPLMYQVAAAVFSVIGESDWSARVVPAGLRVVIVKIPRHPS